MKTSPPPQFSGVCGRCETPPTGAVQKGAVWKGAIQKGLIKKGLIEKGIRRF